MARRVHFAPGKSELVIPCADDSTYTVARELTGGSYLGVARLQVGHSCEGIRADIWHDTF